MPQFYVSRYIMSLDILSITCNILILFISDPCVSTYVFFYSPYDALYNVVMLLLASSSLCYFINNLIMGTITIAFF